jgi:hypothetical protein
MHTLIADESWEQRSIKVFDKEVIQPRLMYWGGGLPIKSARFLKIFMP